MHSSFENLSKIISLIKGGKVGVIPTDTIYGIVGSALNPQTVEKIYQLRKRSTDKPMIILISDLNDLSTSLETGLNHFNIQLTDKMMDFLKKIWPNPVSVVLPIHGEEFKYLHMGTNSLAFRMPKDAKLLDILRQTGPLVAPSANYEGEKASETIAEAKKYFGDEVFYVDGGKIKSEPSTIIQLKVNGSYKILRQGNYKLV